MESIVLEEHLGDTVMCHWEWVLRSLGLGFQVLDFVVGGPPVKTRAARMARSGFVQHSLDLNNGDAKIPRCADQVLRLTCTDCTFRHWPCLTALIWGLSLTGDLMKVGTWNQERQWKTTQAIKEHMFINHASTVLSCWNFVNKIPRIPCDWFDWCHFSRRDLRQRCS